MEPYLFEAITSIEENNHKNFKDPFYYCNSNLSDIYEAFLTTTILCDQKGKYQEFLFHLEDLLQVIEEIRSHYLKQVAEYRRWRINGFQKALYLLLSEEADIAADIVSDCICLLHKETEDSIISYDCLSELESSFKHLINGVSKASKGLNTYYLENLWE
tara:strand:+ start:1129 stop:1605 length:477 start_codon:yes stop_codon:yes gene_type:complete